jgi:hypothetical protein
VEPVCRAIPQFEVPAYFYFTLLPLLRIYWYMAPAPPTCLLKPHLQNKDFLFAQIVLSMHGGSNINNRPQVVPITSFQCFLPCRVIRNPYDSGRNMLMKFSENSDSPQPFMKHASTPALSMDNGFCLCNKLMILPLLRQMQKHPTYLWT